MPRMSTLPDSPAPVTAPPAFDPDLVFQALGFGGRRRMFLRLCTMGSSTAADMAGCSHLKRDATSKQLQELVDAGLATTRADPEDKRRLRYTLASSLHPVQTPEGRWELDFGFCLLRWG
jgi:hypothetical protein